MTEFLIKTLNKPGEVEVKTYVLPFNFVVKGENLNTTKEEYTIYVEVVYTVYYCDLFHDVLRELKTINLKFDKEMFVEVGGLDELVSKICHCYLPPLTLERTTTSATVSVARSIRDEIQKELNEREIR